jgi:hypothetical protein
MSLKRLNLNGIWYILAIYLFNIVELIVRRNDVQDVEKSTQDLNVLCVFLFRRLGDPMRYGV